MKTLIGIIVIIIIAAAGWYFIAQPAEEVLDTEMPVPGMEGIVDEIEVVEEVVATGEVREFIVEGGMFYFSPAQLTVSAGDTVRITFKNTEGVHDWVLDEFEGARTNILNAGEEETIEFVASRRGTFEYYCSVGQYRQMGMVGTLVVGD